MVDGASTQRLRPALDRPCEGSARSDQRSAASTDPGRTSRPGFRAPNRLHASARHCSTRSPSASRRRRCSRRGCLLACTVSSSVIFALIFAVMLPSAKRGLRHRGGFGRLGPDLSADFPRFGRVDAADRSLRHLLARAIRRQATSPAGMCRQPPSRISRMMNLKRSRIIYCASWKLTPAACVPSAAVTGIVARKFPNSPGGPPAHQPADVRVWNSQRFQDVLGVRSSCDASVSGFRR